MSKNLILICLLFLSSYLPDERSEIEEAMTAYDKHLLNMDVDSIAATYAVDGKLGDVVGRDSIRKFLLTFVHLKVLEQNSQTKSIVIRGDMARQEGSYFQQVIVEGDTISVRGLFWTTWMKDKGKGYIRTMTTDAE